MFNLRKNKKDNKGFTLVELVVVIAILAILVGLLVPQYTKYVERSRKSADASNLENMVRAVEITAADAMDVIPAGTYTITLSKAADVAITGDTTDNKIDSILKDIIGNTYATTRLKSSKWSEVDGGNTNGTISATITVDPEGKTDVTYSPTILKDLGNNYTKGTTTGGGSGTTPGA